MGIIFFMNLILDFKCYEKNWVFKLMCKKLQFLDTQFIGYLSFRGCAISAHFDYSEITIRSVLWNFKLLEICT